MIYFLIDLAHGRGHIERCKSLATVMANEGIQFVYDKESFPQEVCWPETYWKLGFLSTLESDDILILDLSPQGYSKELCSDIINCVESHLCGIVALDGGAPDCVASLLDMSFTPWLRSGVSQYRARVGFEWVILKPEMVSWKNHRSASDYFDVFVYGSGYDPLNLGEQVRGLGYKVLEGTNFPPLMAQARLGITRFGITTYELLCMGVPQVCTTDNEGDFEILERLNHEGVLIWAKDHQDIAKSLLELERCDLALMSEKAKVIIDGYGVWRVRDEILRWV